MPTLLAKNQHGECDPLTAKPTRWKKMEGHTGQKYVATNSYSITNNAQKYFMNSFCYEISRCMRKLGNSLPLEVPAGPDTCCATSWWPRGRQLRQTTFLYCCVLQRRFINALVIQTPQLMVDVREKFDKDDHWPSQGQGGAIQDWSQSFLNIYKMHACMHA